MLLDEVFGSLNERKLSDLKNEFYSAIPALRKEMYAEAVREGLFVENPDAVRSRYGCLGIGGDWGWLRRGFLLLAMFGNYSGAAICPGLGLGIAAIGLMILARHMPRRTEKGAEEVRAGRPSSATCRTWRNTPRWKRRRVSSSAICLTRWPSVWSRAGSRSSRRSTPRRRPGGSRSVIRMAVLWTVHGERGHGQTGQLGAGDQYSEGGPAPSLSDMSRGMGSSLAGMSAGLGAMLLRPATS